jgi:hypothetical protein
MQSNVSPLRQPDPTDEGLTVATAQPFRRLAPGIYEARSATIRRQMHEHRAEAA